MEHIGVRETVQFMGLTFNIETLVMTWLAMAVVIVISCLAVKSLKVIPSGWQNFIEIIVVWLHGQIEGMMGKRGMFLAPFIVSLFLFLLVSNLLGLIPFLESPTNDLNTTLGLALLVVCLVHFFGLYFKGGHYIAHFFQPIAPFVVINAIEEIAKPITLAFRLFGNILAGEILIIVLLHLTENPFWLSLPSVAWLGFSIFISCVHAVIFTMLSMAYLGNAVKDSH
ncbi:MAG: F0F1 ATP synthase subunit A [Selenomonadaceae bacterium]|nr:F0F1 ATP synthase subunit A [Selenomonadaceae bacterium]